MLSKWPKDKDPSAIDSCEAVKCCCDVLRECCKDDEQVLELKHLEIVTIRKGKPFTKVPYELNEQQNDINFDSLRSFFDQNALEES